MNTIIDLNTARNVDYNTQSGYEIVFGNQTANTTKEIFSHDTFDMSKCVPITTLTDAVRDVLVDFSFPYGNVQTVTYTGPYSNVGILKINNTTWRAQGIRDTNRYDEIFANTLATDKDGGANSYVQTTTVNDQVGNTRTWSTTINVSGFPTISASGPLVYDEDIQANITQLSVANASVGSTRSWTLTANVANAQVGRISNATVMGNSVTLVGNIMQLNSQLSGNVLKFLPYVDSTSSVANAMQFIISGANTTVTTSTTLDIIIGQTHPEYSLTTSFNYTEDATTNMVWDITDLDTRVSSWTSTFAQSTGNAGVFFINNVSQGVGNIAVVTGNIATINAANVSFLPAVDYSGNIELFYSQTKVNSVFGNVTQASNVAVSMICPSPQTQYNFPTTGTYDQDTLKPFANLIGDVDSRASSYTIDLQQTSGNTGKWYVGGSVYGNATTSLTFTDSKANINSANIQFLPAIDTTANVGITYNQSKINTVYGNVVQANAVVANYTIGNTNNSIDNMIARSYVANTVNNIFSSNTPVIADGSNVGQSYTITLVSSLGKFGNSFANAIAANSYTYTGSMSQVNSQFANVVFVPTPYVPASTGAFTYTQTRNGISQYSGNLTLTGSGGNYNRTVTVSAAGNVALTAQDEYFANTIVVNAVGGGGGGGYKSSSPRGGGGGGGGRLVRTDWGRPTANTISITIGSGGAGSSGGTGGTGGTTTVAMSGKTAVTATGGTGGTSSTTTGSGGTSSKTIYGVTTTYAGGNAYANGTAMYGGGGGSAAAIGKNAKHIPPDATAASGLGGGVTTINGVNVSQGGVGGGNDGGGGNGFGYGFGGGGGGTGGGNIAQIGGNGANGIVFITFT
jgi:hypothetical protein